ncbi:MAG: GNAT family N-acetyltransferase [Ktedonobacterales bacterium]
MAAPPIPPAHAREFGYALNRHYWGYELMPEAARAVTAYEFGVLGSRRIVAECEAPNHASARVMRKCGMRLEGTLYDADLEGNWAERQRYALSAGEFDASTLQLRQVRGTAKRENRSPLAR